MRVFFAVLLIAFSCLAPAQDFPPGAVHGISDTANLISGSDLDKIRSDCDAYQQKIGAPMVVVTIPSLQAENAGDLTIDQYARKLFDHWGIGSQANNFGALVLVSKGDRRARIELGGAWNHEADQESHEIMSEKMVPNFKRGLYSQGIAAGVSAIRGLQPRSSGNGAAGTSSEPAPPPNGFILALGFLACPILFFLLVILATVATIKRAITGQGRTGRRIGGGNDPSIFGGFDGGGSDGGGGGGGDGGGSGGGGGDSGGW